jgi:hypothetical protein
MSDAAAPACPTCGAPLVLDGSYCKRCGYDRAVAGSDDAHLDGVDLPQGYAAEDPYAAPKPEPVKAGKKEWLVVGGIFFGLVAVSILAALLTRGR